MNTENPEHEIAIDRAAKWIVEKRLQSPAILFLELNKPISFLLGQSLYFGAPMLAPLFGFDKLQKAAGILSDKQSLECLICRIEDISAEKDSERTRA